MQHAFYASKPVDVFSFSGFQPMLILSQRESQCRTQWHTEWKLNQLQNHEYIHLVVAPFSIITHKITKYAHTHILDETQLHAHGMGVCVQSKTKRWNNTLQSYIYQNINFMCIQTFFNINQIAVQVSSFSILWDAIFWSISTKHPCCCFFYVFITFLKTLTFSTHISDLIALNSV